MWDNSKAVADIMGEVSLAASKAFFVLRTPSFSLLHMRTDIYSEKTLTLGGSIIIIVDSLLLLQLIVKNRLITD